MVIRYTKAPFGLDGARHVSWIAVGETTVALKSLGTDGTVKDNNIGGMIAVLWKSFGLWWLSKAPDGWVGVRLSGG